MRQTWQTMTIEEKAELVRKLAAEDLSASKIAAQIGGVSRNAIIGFAHRQDILIGSARSRPSVRRKQATPKPAKKNAPVKSVGKATLVARLPDISTEERKSAEIIHLPPKPRPTRLGPVNMLQLDNHTCRWPLSASYRGLDPSEMMFCGKQPDQDSPYCPDCRKISFAGYARRGQVAVSDNGEPVKGYRKRRPFLRWSR